MQRVALARVLVTDPSLLLLDEPMSNLDAALRASLRGELKRIQKDLGQSVLYVTHDQVEAMSLSDRIAIMHEGRLLQLGTPDEIYNRPANRFVAEFIGDPPINMLGCEVISTSGDIVARTALQASTKLGRGRLPVGRYLLAVRPHDLSIVAQPNASAITGSVRFIENLGAENVVHVEYGDELAAVVTPPGVVSVDDKVEVEINPHRAHLIDTQSGAVVALDREAMAA
jgi:multiple sugar transport system ATP-binding protein